MAPPDKAAKIVNLGNIPGGAHGDAILLVDGKLTAKGITVLSDVPENITYSSFPSTCLTSDAPDLLLRRSHKGGFLGFYKDSPSDRLVNSLGRFKSRSFLSIFRFKPWWSTMWVGHSGSDLQMETQWVLLNVPELNMYTIVLPLIEGSFRSALNPGCEGDVLICAESGSTAVKTSSFQAIAYVHVSDNPYNLMKEAYIAARVHLNTFRLLEEKPVPPIVDKFGWCTWDAFYLTVEPLGVWHGINEFVEKGLPPRFLIIDDGWQSIRQDEGKPLEDLIIGGTQMFARLYRFKECNKFMGYREGTLLGPDAPGYDPKRQRMLIAKAIELEDAVKALDRAVQYGVTDLVEFELMIKKKRLLLDEMFGRYHGIVASLDSCATEDGACSEKVEVGMRGFTKDLRSKFKGLDDIYVWQALAGAWGGVMPGDTHLDAKVIGAVPSPNLDGAMTDLATSKLEEGGLGLVHPDQAANFYESMHSYLAKAGITGVKTLEFVCEEYGGRVELAKAYFEGLSKSLVKNFNGTGLLSSMEQCNDFFFLGTSQISFGRVGDDFWFHDPNGDPMGAYWLQGVHMIHCAYNSMWMGQIIHPDWDMFQSTHPCARFHAASRAICGGPVYVSDCVGEHDFELIRSLVFPDGTIPRCRHYALPTRDCLFKNCLSDGKTILKIWNLNKFGGFVGAFNCQGAGWDPIEHRIRGYPHCYNPASGSVHVSDIEWDQKQEASPMADAEEYAVYLSQADKLLVVSPQSGPIDITLGPSSFEIFTYVPVKNLSARVKFAPVGLVDMLNIGGSILYLEYQDGDSEASVSIGIKGRGRFLAYSNARPKKSFLNGEEVMALKYASVQDSLLMDVPWNEDNRGVSNVQFVY